MRPSKQMVGMTPQTPVAAAASPGAQLTDELMRAILTMVASPGDDLRSGVDLRRRSVCQRLGRHVHRRPVKSAPLGNAFRGAEVIDARQPRYGGDKAWATVNRRAMRRSPLLACDGCRLSVATGGRAVRSPSLA